MPAVPSPVSVPAGLVSFRVLVNGQPVPVSGMGIICITVNQALHLPGTATLVLLAGSPAAEESPFNETETFAPGTRVSVAAGYGSDLHVLFQGTVERVAITRQGPQSPQLTVSCSDAATPSAARRPAAAHGSLALTVENGVSLLDFSLAQDARAAITGTVSLLGSHRARPGSTVRLKGLGERFIGPVPVCHVRHTLAGGDWQTRLTLGAGRPPANGQPTANVLAAFVGLGLLGAVVYMLARRWRPRLFNTV